MKAVKKTAPRGEAMQIFVQFSNFWIKKLLCPVDRAQFWLGTALLISEVRWVFFMMQCHLQSLSGLLALRPFKKTSAGKGDATIKSNTRKLTLVAQALKLTM